MTKIVELDGERFELEADWRLEDGELLVSAFLDGDRFEASVERAAGESDNPAPSEAAYVRQLDELLDSQESCLACIFDEEGGWQPYDDHMCIARPEPFVFRPYATEFLPKLGRPEWVRVEFTKHEAGERLVPLWDPYDKQINPDLGVTPLDWDFTAEYVTSKRDSWERVRFLDDGERAERRAEVRQMMATS